MRGQDSGTLPSETSAGTAIVATQDGLTTPVKKAGMPSNGLPCSRSLSMQRSLALVLAMLNALTRVNGREKLC